MPLRVARCAAASAPPCCSAHASVGAGRSGAGVGRLERAISGEPALGCWQCCCRCAASSGSGPPASESGQHHGHLASTVRPRVSSQNGLTHAAGKRGHAALPAAALEAEEPLPRRADRRELPNLTSRCSSRRSSPQLAAARHSSPQLATARHSPPQLATARLATSSPQLATARHSSPQLATAPVVLRRLATACGNVTPGA